MTKHIIKYAKYLAVLSLLTFAMSSKAQPGVTNWVIATFDREAALDNSGTNTDNASGSLTMGTPYINWFGTAYWTNEWDTSDASNNPNSGSLKIVAYFPNATNNGCCGSQFLVMDGFGGIGGGNGFGYLVTNMQCDIRIDGSTTATNNGNFPLVEIGTRGSAFSQNDFGTLQLNTGQTNWTHVSLLVNAAANTAITNIPSIYFKIFSTLTGQVIMYVDNIVLSGPAAGPAIHHPKMSLASASPAMRIFAGSTASIYDREQITTLDENQSWIGGTFPVSYSLTILGSTARAAGFQTHMFLIPATGNTVTGNQYMDYGASNEVWLQINSVGDGTVTANVSWKTNGPQSNPNVTAVNITNSTIVGTWTVTFTSDTQGTLTAPGASPAPFTITDANVDTDFANPLVAAFGVQPNGNGGIGQYNDYGHISTAGVMGVPVNDTFGNDTNLDLTVWDPSNSAKQASIQVVNSADKYWLTWDIPDTDFGLAISPDLSNASDWHVPAYWNSSNGNPGTAEQLGSSKWLLITPDILPSNPGTNNPGAPFNNGAAFFRLENPAPTQ